MSGKEKLGLQEALDLLPNLPTEISDVLTDDFSDEKKLQQIICWNFHYILKMTIKRLNKIQGAVVHVKKIQYFLP
ncbi:hypothetical protein TNCV_4281491 [Trichonephila clavipes]|nr:hypothetical protein TNCV_4281491 [Trichonephila clavipes]